MFFLGWSCNRIRTVPKVKRVNQKEDLGWVIYLLKWIHIVKADVSKEQQTQEQGVACAADMWPSQTADETISSPCHLTVQSENGSKAVSYSEGFVSPRHADTLKVG